MSQNTQRFRVAEGRVKAGHEYFLHWEANTPLPALGTDIHWDQRGAIVRRETHLGGKI